MIDILFGARSFVIRTGIGLNLRNSPSGDSGRRDIDERFAPARSNPARCDGMRVNFDFPANPDKSNAL